MNLILVVEDNPAHAELMRRALAEAWGGVRVDVAETGEAALDYLHCRGAHAARAEGAPALLFLDLRLPGMDGLSVLQAIKDDERLRRIPVVVLSSSESREDIHAAYVRHANSYLVKPAGYQALQNLMRACGWYWIECNRPASA